MSKKIVVNRRTLIYTFLMFLFSLVAVVLECNHIQLAVATIAFFIIFKIAKFSYFSVFSFILWFSFLQEYFASISREMASGRLRFDASVPIYITEFFECIMFFFIVEILVLLNSNVLQHEKTLYKSVIWIPSKIAHVYIIIAFLLVLLAYPSMPKLSADLLRDEGILPSSLVVPISLLLLGVTYDYFKKSVFFKILTVLTLFWIMFHGDRVIVLGYVVYFFLRFMNDGRYNFSNLKSILLNRRVLIAFILLLAIAALSIKIQTTRMGDTYHMSITELFYSLLKQGTACDIVHAFNCSVDMWKRGNSVNGYSYLYYLYNLLPSADLNTYSAVTLVQNYSTMGGGLFFCEPMMNGGIILCFAHTIVFVLLVCWAFDGVSVYHQYVIIPFCILIFRFAWYATCAGLVKMLLYYVPVVYFISKKCKA